MSLFVLVLQIAGMNQCGGPKGQLMPIIQKHNKMSDYGKGRTLVLGCDWTDQKEGTSCFYFAESAIPKSAFGGFHCKKKLYSCSPMVQVSNLRCSLTLVCLHDFNLASCNNLSTNIDAKKGKMKY